MPDEKRCRTCGRPFKGDGDTCPNCRYEERWGRGLMSREDLERIKSQQINLRDWFDRHPPGHP